MVSRYILQVWSVLGCPRMALADPALHATCHGALTVDPSAAWSRFAAACNCLVISIDFDPRDIHQTWGTGFLEFQGGSPRFTWM